MANRIAQQLCNECGAEAGEPHVFECRNNVKTFRELVAEMRHYQKEFFRTKSRSALESSKAVERAVDKALKGDDGRRLF